MGQIYRRDGSKYLWLDYHDERGRRVRKSSGQENEAAAQRVLDEAEGRVAKTIANKNRLPYKDAVVDVLGRVSVKNTKDGYTASARAFRPYLSPLYMDEITADHIRQFVVDRRKAGASDATIQQNIMFLSGLFRRSGIFPNPAQDFFRLKMLQPVHKTMRILSVEEEDRLMSVLETDLHRALVGISLETGLRRSELLTLRNHQIVLTGRPEIRLQASQTKTKRHRIVPLTKKALALYETVKPKPKDKGAVVDLVNDWVFRQPHGGRVLSVKQFFDTARNRAQLPDLRWHDLRHTFATRFLRAVPDLHTLAKIMGHSNTTTTEIYLHFAADDLHDRIQQFDSLR